MLRSGQRNGGSAVDRKRIPTTFAVEAGGLDARVGDGATAGGVHREAGWSESDVFGAASAADHADRVARAGAADEAQAAAGNGGVVAQIDVQLVGAALQVHRERGERGVQRGV